MPAFGAKSREILSTVDDDLVQVLEEVVKHRDITIISGKRGKQEQDDIFRRGMSKVMYPNSKHNVDRKGSTKGRAIAVDIAPYPINWKDENDFIYVAGMVVGIAASMGIKIRWGGDWDRDGDALDDQTFQDLGHFELVL